MSLLRLGAARRGLLVFPGARMLVRRYSDDKWTSPDLSAAANKWRFKDAAENIDKVKDAIPWDGLDYIYVFTASSYTVSVCCLFFKVLYDVKRSQTKSGKIASEEAVASEDAVDKIVDKVMACSMHASLCGCLTLLGVIVVKLSLV
jgi:hypothetical protein